MEEVNKTINNPYGFIYITTNIINGMRYLGQKSFDDNNKWKKYLGSGKVLKNAIKKYGKQNFHRNIVCFCYSLEELNETEYALSIFLNVVEDDGWYNLCYGGGVPIGYVVTDESKQKMSESQKARWTDELRQELKEKISGEGNPFYGKHHTDDTKNKLSEIRSIPVVQLGLNGEYIAEFKSGREAYEMTGVDETTINGCCCGKIHCKSGGGFLWVYKKDYNPDDNVLYDHNGLRPVVQLDKLGNFISEYNTIKDASIKTGVNNSNITMCCQGDINMLVDIFGYIKKNTTQQKHIYIKIQYIKRLYK